MERNYSTSPTSTDWARYQEYLREDDIFTDSGSMQALCSDYLREIDDGYMSSQMALMEAD